MRVLALVTARGGSKRFPGKNLASLAGLPLVTWSLRHLLDLRHLVRSSGIEVEPVLSTDQETIAAAWPEPWRPRRLRPAQLAADDTRSEAVIADALDQCSTDPDAFLLLQPTSPLLRPTDLLALVMALQEGASSAMLVAPWDHPPHWVVADDGTGCHRSAWPDAVPVPGDPLRPVGAWAVGLAQWRATGSLVQPGATRLVRLPAERAVDIDHAVDLQSAAALLGATARPAFRAGPLDLAGDRCCVIAEAGVNHNGDPDLAHRLVDAAADAGADAVKFQIFRTEELVTADAPQAGYQERNTGRQRSQATLLKELELPLAAFAALRDHATERGLIFLATAFDAASLAGLVALGVPALKVPSGECTNHLLLQEIAATGLPVLLSTGMADMWEVLEAVRCLERGGCPELALFHCVSSYPTPPAACHLRAMTSLCLATGQPVGWSDHTAGWTIALAAVAAGAVVLEKHLTLDRSLPGPDHAASIEPADFAAMVSAIRAVGDAQGTAVKAPQPCEADVGLVARRSLHVRRAVLAGSHLGLADLCARRPGTGISPSRLAEVLGRPLIVDRQAGAQLTWEDLG